MNCPYVTVFVGDGAGAPTMAALSPSRVTAQDNPPRPGVAYSTTTS